MLVASGVPVVANVGVYNAVSILAGAERELGPAATRRVVEEKADRTALIES